MTWIGLTLSGDREAETAVRTVRNLGLPPPVLDLVLAGPIIFLQVQLQFLRRNSVNLLLCALRRQLWLFTKCADVGLCCQDTSFDDFAAMKTNRFINQALSLLLFILGNVSNGKCVTSRSQSLPGRHLVHQSLTADAEFFFH